MAKVIEVISAFQQGRDVDAIQLVFEYMQATQAETGRPIPASIEQLPPVLQAECRDLARIYRSPGVLLVAYKDGHPAGCVGLAPRRLKGTGEVKRLYVRPADRGGNIGRVLMERVHHHAEQHRFERLVLDVLPSRIQVIDFYRRLGYSETEQFATESPVPMVYMHRLVNS